ncbi:MAG: Spy/CpxP family protein refolding chaperone [Pseudorhodoplanes sp.]|uniref:Spy/CpxP family protein refolding chaperone n=1 Tax=Pseudorhodoplanes sp. TaxID=1934341 RepID=UPI003D09B12F
MLKLAFFALGAILLVTSPAAAQQAGQTQQTDGARGAGRLSADDRQALLDARVAALRTGLKLTPEQEKNWPSVESAIRELAKQRAEAAAQRRANRQARREKSVERDPIARLRANAALMSQRAAGLERLADAAEPLYRSLDDGQKRRLRALTRQAMGRPFVPRR